jgi:hypothetical protein
VDAKKLGKGDRMDRPFHFFCASCAFSRPTGNYSPQERSCAVFGVADSWSGDRDMRTGSSFLAAKMRKRRKRNQQDAVHYSFVAFVSFCEEAIATVASPVLCTEDNEVNEGLFRVSAMDLLSGRNNRAKVRFFALLALFRGQPAITFRKNGRCTVFGVVDSWSGDRDLRTGSFF